MALLTFLIGLTASYNIRTFNNRFIDFWITDDLPQQELFNEAIESRDVYSAVLQQAFIRHRYTTVVIQTSSEDSELLEKYIYTCESPTVQQFFARERAAMPVDVDTVADYVLKNEKHGELFLKDLGIRNDLISREEASQLFENGGWQAFYKRYPGSLGLVSFSKVGFNSTHDQAFVYVGSSCQLLCGDGNYILLNKEDGRWTVKVVQEIWVS